MKMVTVNMRTPFKIAIVIGMLCAGYFLVFFVCFERATVPGADSLRTMWFVRDRFAEKRDVLTKFYYPILDVLYSEQPYK